MAEADARSAYNCRMGIRKWFARQRKEVDADALERAEEELNETPEERQFSEATGTAWPLTIASRAVPARRRSRTSTG